MRTVRERTKSPFPLSETDESRDFPDSLDTSPGGPTLAEDPLNEARSLTNCFYNRHKRSFRTPFLAPALYSLVFAVFFHGPTVCFACARGGRMCYSSRVRGWGGCIISVEHRVAFHMDFPCVLKLFGLHQSLLHTVNRALCPSAGPFVFARVLWMSSCQSACPPGLSRATLICPPPVSGILSFLFSSRAEPVLQSVNSAGPKASAARCAATVRQPAATSLTAIMVIIRVMVLLSQGLRNANDGILGPSRSPKKSKITG